MHSFSNNSVNLLTRKKKKDCYHILQLSNLSSRRNLHDNSSKLTNGQVKKQLFRVSLTKTNDWSTFCERCAMRSKQASISPVIPCNYKSTCDQIVKTKLRYKKSMVEWTITTHKKNTVSRLVCPLQPNPSGSWNHPIPSPYPTSNPPPTQKKGEN